MELKISLLSCVFPPEPVVSARTSADLASALVACRYSVTVVTSYPSRPAGRIYSGYHRRLFERCIAPAGYQLVRCFSVPSAESSSLSRFVENLIFGLSAALYLFFSPRPDLIYANTWPIFATGLMALVASLRRIPYIISVQDVYPESFTAQGRASLNSPFYRLMRWIDTQIARRAAHIILISPSFACVYTGDRRVSPERVTVIPNWAEEDSLPADVHAAAALRQKFAIPGDAFLAAYGGNIGVAAGVETFVNAFRHLDKGVYGLIAGDGSRLSACQEKASGLPRLSFFTPWPAEQTMSLYQAADVLILPTHGSQSTASVPSKLIRYMLSGRPIIAAGLPGSELSRIIASSGCGWLVSPDQPSALAEKILYAKSLPPSELQSRGESGRNYALQNFTSQSCIPKLINIVEKVTS